MPRTPRASLLVVSFLALAAFAACGGGDDTASPSSSAGASGSGTAGAATAGSGVAGKGAAGTGTAGKGTSGSGTAGSGTAGSTTAGTAGAGTSGSGTAGKGTAGSGTAGTGAAGAAGGACEAFGHFGVPTATFTIPKPSGTSISYPDIQKSFPSVDWANLERLYVPAGEYKTFQIGNLPVRDPAKPLVITNQGGQVKVGPNLGGNFIWSMGGGAGWVLTGRYDADSKTGDAAFPGHRCGAYANSRGTYGFLSDDALDTSGPYLHMGIAVGDATDFEIEFVEVTRSGFAGIRLLNKREAGDPEKMMANVRVHDTYVHDTAAEGFYFGWTGAPPSNRMPGLEVYNNRLIRTGNEALQIQQLAEGSHVHDNTMAFAGLHWLDNGLGAYQDNNTQVLVREGKVTIERNVFLGGKGTLLSFFSSPDAGDAGRTVTFSNNVFSETASLVGYLNGTSTGDSSFTFDGNVFSRAVFHYDDVDPGAKAPTAAFGVNGAVKAPVTFQNNAWDFDLPILNGIAGTDGTAGMFTAKGNTKGPVAAVTFVDSGYPAGADVQALTVWSARATRLPGMPLIQYKPGALVMDDAELYQCTADSQDEPPKSTPAKWKKLPPPADDVRTPAGSPYAAMGVK